MVVGVTALNCWRVWLSLLLLFVFSLESCFFTQVELTRNWRLLDTILLEALFSVFDFSFCSFVYPLAARTVCALSERFGGMVND